MNMFLDCTERLIGHHLWDAILMFQIRLTCWEVFLLEDLLTIFEEVHCRLSKQLESIS